MEPYAHIMRELVNLKVAVRSLLRHHVNSRIPHPTSPIPHPATRISQRHYASCL